MAADYILLVLHFVLTIMYGRLAYLSSQKRLYGFCSGCWALCLVLDIIKLFIV